MTQNCHFFKIGILVGTVFFSSFSWSQSKSRSGKKNTNAAYMTYKKGILLDLAYSFASNNTVSSSELSSDGASQSSNLDIKLGYINRASFYYGGQYTSKNEVNQTAASAAVISSTSGKGSGFGLGYFWEKGFDLRLFYRFHESYSYFSKGSGYQANFGYSTKLGGSILLGVLVDYREIKYDAYSLNTNFVSRTIRTIQPALTLGFLID